MWSVNSLNEQADHIVLRQCFKTITETPYAIAKRKPFYTQCNKLVKGHDVMLEQHCLRNCQSFLSWFLLMFMRSFFSRKLKVKTRRSIPCVALFWVNSWCFVSATITQTHTLQHFSVKDTCYARSFSALDALCNWLLIILLRNTGVSLMF